MRTAKGKCCRLRERRLRASRGAGLVVLDPGWGFTQFPRRWLACLTDAAGRHKSLGSETMDFSTLMAQQCIQRETLSPSCWEGLGSRAAQDEDGGVPPQQGQEPGNSGA